MPRVTSLRTVDRKRSGDALDSRPAEGIRVDAPPRHEVQWDAGTGAARARAAKAAVEPFTERRRASG